MLGEKKGKQVKNIIIGTAGHVDHGKTLLIKTLSGIDTDRLVEEKKRGITIENGFAHIPNDAGYNIGVIDVPGHERFINNMLAGIGGVDFVLFVIAADEGVMPQTKEHFEILQALGIEDGIIVITKKDMVEEEWLEMVIEDVKDYFAGSFLDGKPLFAVSAKTGENMAALKEAIIEKCDREANRLEDPRAFRIPIDRVFSMRGFGTVVTGTLLDGSVRVGEEQVLYPQETKVKIRGIQTYNESVEEAVAGERTAVNLSDVKTEEIARGDVLAAPGAVTVTNMIDAELRMFRSADRQIKNNSRVHFYVGAKQVLAKVILLDREAAGAGENVYVQFRLEEPVALRRGDRFIVRFYSPIITVGGGIVLDAMPEKHKRNREDVLAHVAVLAGGDLPAIVRSKTGQHRFYREEELGRELGLLPEKMHEVTEAEIAAGRMSRLSDETLLSADRLSFFREYLRKMLEAYHAENPLASGMPKQELLNRIGEGCHIDDERCTQALVRYFLEEGTIADREKDYALAGFTASFTEEQEALKAKIRSMYEKAGVEMLKNEEVYALHSDKRVIQAIQTSLAEGGAIVKVNPSYFISADGWKAAVAAAEKAAAETGSFVLAAYRDTLNTSRKYAAELLPALDRAGITHFNGENRTFHG